MQNDQNLNAEEVALSPVLVEPAAIETPEVIEAVPVEEANSYEDEIRVAIRQRAKKDMLYGALWCVGGLGLTLANVGFIFWGAILFGGIQFFRGLSNYNKA